jgi:hypothetical protein
MNSKTEAKLFPSTFGRLDFHLMKSIVKQNSKFPENNGKPTIAKDCVKTSSVSH